MDSLVVHIALHLLKLMQARTFMVQKGNIILRYYHLVAIVIVEFRYREFGGEGATCNLTEYLHSLCNHTF